MTELLNTFLTLILNYGYPVILLCMILSYLGLPLSLNAVLLAAGAFSVDGTLNILILIPMVAIVAILGDVFGYYLGRRFQYVLLNSSFMRKIGITNQRLVSVNVFFQKWGGLSVFLTRFLLTPIGIPTNLVAGVSNYSFKKFLFLVILGEFLWSFLYVGLGYYFGANWIVLWNYISDAPQILVLFTLGFGLVFFNLRHWKTHKS